MRHYERRLVLVRDLQGYLVIARVAVEEAQQGTPSSGVNDLVDALKREGVFRAVT
jgi:hypothetical protein